MKYQKWMSKNTTSLKGKKVLFVGATGSIGLRALEYLIYLEADVMIAARNIEKANHLVENLSFQGSNSNIKIEYLDVSSIESIENFLKKCKTENLKFDYYINNAGVYHLPEKDTKDGVDITFATNALGNGILTNHIQQFLNLNGKIILTSSISYRFYKVNLTDIEGRRIHKKIKKYSLSKRVMLMNTLYLKEKRKNRSISMNLCHPGICATELFQKSHSKAFMIFIFPLMKLIFHSPTKSSLTIIKSLFVDTKQNEWIGPKGLLDVWGFPGIKRIKKDTLNMENCEKIHSFINSFDSIQL